ncbi:MAG: hypothetical protein KC486_11360 [Myxococcales bacterium]|nr:hypothetical protein [Myxococcales bacterium]
MRPPCTSSSLPAARALALALLAAACGSDLDRLPGTYVGSLDSANQHSRMANLRPDDAGAYQADITHYSGGDTRQGAQVTIRKVGEAAGNPVFEADLAGLCTLRFEGHDGGHLGDGLQSPTCACMADGRPIEGSAVLLGSLHEGRLELTVSVVLPGPEYSGGCTHHFIADARPE